MLARQHQVGRVGVDVMGGCLGVGGGDFSSYGDGPGRLVAVGGRRCDHADSDRNGGVWVAAGGADDADFSAIDGVGFVDYTSPIGCDGGAILSCQRYTIAGRYMGGLAVPSLNG